MLWIQLEEGGIRWRGPLPLEANVLENVVKERTFPMAELEEARHGIRQLERCGVVCCEQCKLLSRIISYRNEIEN